MRAGTIASPQTMLKWNRANSVLKYKVSSLLLYVTAFYFLLLTWHLELCPLSSVGFFFGGEEGVGIVKVAGDVNLCSAWSFLKLWFLFYYIQLKAVLIKVTNPWFFLSLHWTAHPVAEVSKSTASMARTIGIAVGCAAAYIVLVVGLMIYCKGRRARQNRKEEVLPPECENCKCRRFLNRQQKHSCFIYLTKLLW